MAETTTSLVTAIGRRVRDPNSTAHSSTNVIGLLNHVQRIINAATSAVKSTVTLAMSTAQPNGLFLTATSLATLIRAERVIHQGKDVPRSDWRQFFHHDPYWARVVGPRPLLWDRVGLGLFCITPTKPGDSVSVIGPKVLTALTTAGQATELPDQHMPAMVAMVEQLLLQRQRLFTSVKPSVDAMQRLLPAGIP